MAPDTRLILGAKWQHSGKQEVPCGPQSTAICLHPTQSPSAELTPRPPGTTKPKGRCSGGSISSPEPSAHWLQTDPHSHLLSGHVPWIPSLFLFPTL